MRRFCTIVSSSFLILAISSSSLNAREEKQDPYPVVILGGGIGAMTSAIYLSRAGINPLVLEGELPGGAIAQSPIVQNWPGEIEISGIDLSDKVRKQAEVNGAQFSQEEVIDVDISQRPFTLITRDLTDGNLVKKIQANSLIIALGSTPNFLGIPGENGYWTKGVYNCAVCDGGLYKNKTVAVVGGGDAAITEATYLSNIVKKIYLFVRKDFLKGIEENRKKELLSKPNIEVCYNTVVKEIQGDGQKVTHVLVENTSDHKLYPLELDALFLAIGAKPNSTLFKDKLELDAQGYIILKKDQLTSQEGVFAIGDIVDPIYKQAISAAGDAAKAALQAEKYLSSLSVMEEKRLALQNELYAKTQSKKGRVIEISSMDQFDREIHHSHMTFIDFYSTHCPPCRKFSGVFESWSKEHHKAKFIRVNIDSLPSLANAFQIFTVPALVVLDKNGIPIEKKTGLKELTHFGSKIHKVIHEHK